MKGIRIVSLVIIAVLTTATCLLTTTSNTLAQNIGPHKFKCEDGRIFTITFIKKKGEIAPEEARLVFEKSNSTEILINQRGASGCSYANGKYWYSEHKGDVSLLDMTSKRKDYWMPCKKIK